MDREVNDLGFGVRFNRRCESLSGFSLSASAIRENRRDRARSRGRMGRSNKCRQPWMPQMGLLLLETQEQGVISGFLGREAVLELFWSQKEPLQASRAKMNHLSIEPS